MGKSKEPRKGKLSFKETGQLDEVCRNKSSDGLVFLSAVCHFQVVYQVFVCVFSII
jgi:hypothetical protein